MSRYWLVRLQLWRQSMWKFVCALALAQCWGVLGYELSCQPPTRHIRLIHAEELSPKMVPLINSIDGMIGTWDAWLSSTFSSGTVTGVFSFTNKQIQGGTGDFCSKEQAALSSSDLVDKWLTLPIGVGQDHAENSVLDLLYAISQYDWNAAQSLGRRIVTVYTNKRPSQSPTAGLPPFDNSLLCENVDYPSVGEVISALDALNIYVIFVVPVVDMNFYQSLFPTQVVVPFSTDSSTLLENVQSGIDYIYCGAPLPTQGPEASTPVTIPTPCTEDAVLQLLHIQDISWSYTNDTQNVKDHFSDLLGQLTDKFYSVNLALASFSDKPFDPVGYGGDYCFREDLAFTDVQADFITELNDLKILSGRDWKESQYDAINDGVRSATMGWNLNDEVDGRKIIRVVMLATDASPHVGGDFPSLPNDDTLGCEQRDYPTPGNLGTLLDSRGIYPIFLVTSDIDILWKAKASQVTKKASVLELGQPTSDLFDEIVEILEKVCLN